MNINTVLSDLELWRNLSGDGDGQKCDIFSDKLEKNLHVKRLISQYCDIDRQSSKQLESVIALHISLFS